MKRFYAAVKSVIELLSLDERWSPRVMARLSAQKNALAEGLSSLGFGPEEESLLLALRSSNLDSVACRQIAGCLGFNGCDYVHGFADEVLKLKVECRKENGNDAGMDRSNVEHYAFICNCIDALERSIDEAKAELCELDVPLCSKNSYGDVVLKEALSFVDSSSIEQPRSNRKEEGLLDKGLSTDLNIDCVAKYAGESEVSHDNGLSLDPIDRLTGDEAENMKLRSACNALHQIVPVPGSKEEYMKALHVLIRLCEEDSHMKRKIASQNIIPLLVQLTEANDCGLRQEALSILDILAVDQECQVIFVH
jgi:hypothetical protein